MNIPAIKLDNISKAYNLYPTPIYRLIESLGLKRNKHKTHQALKGINLNINSGEVVGIVGNNGSGKSTLLKLICGIIQPTNGKVQINGKISALIELGSGFNPDLSGIENVIFFGCLMGFTKKEMLDKLDEILAFADIGKFVNYPLKKYSNGMKARLAFSVASHVDPDILIVDEVLSVGDELFRRKCYARMEKFFMSQKTVLYVSHNLNSIISLCNRAIFLNNGALLLDSDPKTVTTYYQKYLFADHDKRSEVLSEIHQLGSNPSVKFDHNSNKPQKPKKISTNPKDLKSKPKLKPFFLPTFKSKSLVEYRNREVDIVNLRLNTIHGEKVNVINIDETYVFSYDVKFDCHAQNVGFSMKIKHENGLGICGATSQGMNKTIPQVVPGDNFVIQWKFNCLVSPGCYFFNAGVTGEENDERIILNRISDGCVFRVQKNLNFSVYDLVYLQQSIEISKRK